MDQLPVAIYSSSVSLISEILHHISDEKKVVEFSKFINATILNLYFSDHMKERGIDVLDFVERDIKDVMKGREFEKLSDIEKEQVIEQLHAKWSHSDNEVVKRMAMFKERSPDILKPILES